MNNPNKPFSQACENNKQPILEVLQRHFVKVSTVLEVGSGTGQHAVFFGEQLPQVQWQTADLPEFHSGICAWLEAAQAEGRCNNVTPPLALEAAGRWPEQAYDAVFSANTLHIMSWENVTHFFPGASSCLKSGGLLCVYGPFNYNGQFTSESNARFNNWLQQQNAYSAIRDFEAVNKLAAEQQLELVEDNAMPANNRLLVWRKA